MPLATVLVKFDCFANLRGSCNFQLPIDMSVTREYVMNIVHVLVFLEPSEQCYN
jgi:hypothetical protein